MAAGNSSTSLSSTSLPALIDSTLPYIFLPLSVCQKFEAAFGITWNEDVGAYLVNETLHTQLQAQNANVTFTLGNSTAGATIDISLPYAAFDLIASYPLLTNSSSRYFPLMRATNESQYTLGRTFLQEAYLTADYERHNFSVSQCSWIADSKQSIVAIPPLPSIDATMPNLTIGAIAGGVIGGAVVLVLIAVFTYRIWSRIRQAKIGRTRPSSPGPEVDAVEEAKFELPSKGDQSGEHELDARFTAFPGHEIGSNPYPGAELESQGGWPVYEMPAREEPASEMPTKGALDEPVTVSIAKQLDKP